MPSATQRMKNVSGQNRQATTKGTASIRPTVRIFGRFQDRRELEEKVVIAMSRRNRLDAPASIPAS